VHLVDPDILIDLARNPARQEAEQWVSSLIEVPMITTINASEVLQGARNKKELLQYSAFLEKFEMVSASVLDQKDALRIFKSVYLPAGVSFNDA
jgi:predicted nucleic acid-binding protein